MAQVRSHLLSAPRPLRGRPVAGSMLAWVAIALVFATTLSATACNVANSLRPTQPVPTPRRPVPPTATPAPQIQSWYQAALGERSARVFADLSRHEAQELATLLSQRHPGLAVDWTIDSDRDLLARALADRSDGAPTWDVFVGDLGTLLEGAGLAARWIAPEASALRAGFAHQDGAWYGVAVTYHVLQLHTEQVAFGQRPTRYEDLAEPRFLGRLAVDADALGWFKGLIESGGHQATVDTLKGLAQQGVVSYNDPRHLADLVSAGRHAVAVANRLDAVERNRRAGAKTAWVAIEPVVVQPTVAVIHARASQPNAARLFVNLLLSADGQTLLARQGRVPSRQDVDPDPQSLVRGLQTHFTLPPEGQLERDLRALYADLWR